MRMDPIRPFARAGTATRRRVDLPGSGAAGGPGAPAPGGATRRALAGWPAGHPRTPERSDPRAVRGPGTSRPFPEHFAGDEVEMESHLVLENDPNLIPGLVAELSGAAARLGLFDGQTAECVAVALTEALINGIQHGNLELDSRLRRDDEASYDRVTEFRRCRPPYRDRRLHVRARLSPAEAIYVIRDEGPGFDPATLPDPTDPVNLERTTGRGLLLIRAFMDVVAFNGAGNQITLVKRRTTIPDARGR